MAGPHQGQPVMTTGAALDSARAAMVLVHGRGATAESILTLAGPLGREDFAYLAPQAANDTWYPQSFLAPMQYNEPGISSGLQAIADLLGLIEEHGLPLEKVVLLGFSQGGCLTTEFAARNARRFGGLAALSGGLIGPPGTPRDYTGTFDGMPAFFGCSDVDSHIPKERVEESAQVLERMGAAVTLRLYPGMGHTVNDDEIVHVQAMMDAVLAA